MYENVIKRYFTSVSLRDIFLTRRFSYFGHVSQNTNFMSHRQKERCGCTFSADIYILCSRQFKGSFEMVDV